MGFFNSTVTAVRLKLTEDMLGTVPLSGDVYSAHILKKLKEVPADVQKQEAEINAISEEELETVPDAGHGHTGFMQDDKGLFIYNYMIKGHLKTCLEVGMENGIINKIPAYSKWVDRLVFIRPRRIYFGVKEPDGALERPLRARTPQGIRVTVVKSDIIQAGREICFSIEILKNKHKDNRNGKLYPDILRTAMGYGEYYGLGQWRGSGGYGTYTIEDFAPAS